MITLLVTVLAVLACAALVVTIVDRRFEWTWRDIAAERRRRWEERQRDARWR